MLTYAAVYAGIKPGSGSWEEVIEGALLVVMHGEWTRMWQSVGRSVAVLFHWFGECFSLSWDFPSL